MQQYIFILGNNPKLSQAEIKAVLPRLEIVAQSPVFLMGQINDLDCQTAMNILGGTIKIGRVIGDQLNQNLVVKELVDKYSNQKIKFGFSFYGVKPDTKIGLVIKKVLKQKGISSRVVTSREPSLSAVIVKKEKVVDFIVTEGVIAVTEAVQPFEEFGQRDFGRPKSDSLSGMLPPKLARMMVNLAQVSKTELISDPFCGSGTILAEAMDLGYKNIIGSDISNKAVDNSLENINWLKNKLELTDDQIQINIFAADVSKLSANLTAETVAAVVTEPYLGKPIKGYEKISDIKKIITELSDLYIQSFREFKKIIKSKGKIVMVFPQWHLNHQIFDLDIDSQIKVLGFRRLDKNDLIYSRPDQKVWRRILIWQKK